MRRRLSLVAGVGAVALVASACSTAGRGPTQERSGAVTFAQGGGGELPAVTGADGAAPPPAADVLAVRPESAASPLPAVAVRVLPGGDYVQLKNLLPADRPLLVCFGAPH